MANVVGPKGQVVIEKPIRDALNLQMGYITVQKLVNDHVEIYFFPPEHSESLRGILAGVIQNSIPPEKWADAEEAAWTDSQQREWNVQVS